MTVCPRDMTSDPIYQDRTRHRVRPCGSRRFRARSAPEHRPRVDTGVELTALAARIDRSAEDRASSARSNSRPAKARVELPRVDTRKPRPQAAIDHLVPRAHGSGYPRREAAARVPCPPAAPSRYRRMSSRNRSPNAACVNPFAQAFGDGCAHLCLVDVIRTRMRNVHDVQRQAGRARLRLEHRAPDTVHRHAIHRLVHRRQQCRDSARVLAG